MFFDFFSINAYQYGNIHIRIIKIISINKHITIKAKNLKLIIGLSKSKSTAQDSEIIRISNENINIKK